jgi:hypothetical protein
MSINDNNSNQKNKKAGHQMATVMQANKNTASLSCIECKGLSSKFIINLAIDGTGGTKEE